MMNNKVKSIAVRIATYFVAVYMFVGAVAHVVKPEMFSAMIPPFMPEWFANGFAFVAELGIAIMVLLPKYRHWGGLAFLMLCLGFLPLHVWDLFRPDPAIGEPPAPAIRVIVQFVYMYIGWSIWKFYQPKSRV